MYTHNSWAHSDGEDRVEVGHKCHSASAIGARASRQQNHYHTGRICIHITICYIYLYETLIDIAWDVSLRRIYSVWDGATHVSMSRYTVRSHTSLYVCIYDYSVQWHIASETSLCAVTHVYMSLYQWHMSICLYIRCAVFAVTHLYMCHCAETYVYMSRDQVCSETSQHVCIWDSPAQWHITSDISIYVSTLAPQPCYVVALKQITSILDMI